MYELKEPNDCNFNFIQIFDEKTDIEHRKRYFCGSVAEAYQSETDVLFIRSARNWVLKVFSIFMNIMLCTIRTCTNI